MWSEYVPEGWTLIVSTIGIEPAMGYRVVANDVYKNISIVKMCIIYLQGYRGPESKEHCRNVSGSYP